MGGQGGLRPKKSVGEALGAFASDILSEARAAIETPGRSDAEAVHNFRKAMKRWRAFLRLLERSLGEEARRLRDQAGDLARELSAARDGQSALDALADLGTDNETLSARSIATITSRLNAVRESAEATALTETVRARMRLTIEAGQMALAEWPLKELRFGDVAAALAEGYRRTRKAVPAEWPQADSEELHDLRKRVVAHRYQMELVEPLWPRLGKVWVGEAQRLRERLGTCQDLAVLERLTAPRQPLAPWRSRLVPLIAARQFAHVAAARRIAGRLFAERPGAFRRRLENLWESGRDAG